MKKYDDSSTEIKQRIWFIHMNQSNPLLDESSPQTQTVLEQGFNVAREGVRLPL